MHLEHIAVTQVLLVTIQIATAQYPSCFITGAAGDLCLEVSDNGTIYCEQDLAGTVDPSEIFIQNGPCYMAYEANCTSLYCFTESSSLVSGKTHKVTCEYVVVTTGKPTTSDEKTTLETTSTTVYDTTTDVASPSLSDGMSIATEVDSKTTIQTTDVTTNTMSTLLETIDSNTKDTKPSQTTETTTPVRATSLQSSYFSTSTSGKTSTIPSQITSNDPPINKITTYASALQATTRANGDETDLGLILGLTIGLGVGLILVGSISWVLYVRFHKKSKIHSSDLLENSSSDAGSTE